MIDGHAQLKAQLKRFGVEVHTLQPHSLKEHWGVARELGRLFEREREAKVLIKAQQSTLQRSLATLPPLTPPPRVLIEVWPKPLSVAGAESFMGDLVRVAGGTPIPSDLGEWPQLTPELLMTLNPEVILVASEARAQQLLSPSAPKAWRSLKAVRARRVYAREGRLERPGPRLIGELVWLAERLRDGH
jgi:iron complex transport system substrate-binding protein